ncbi:MAG: hypothetical protein ACYC5M_09690 [Anaerolineae bacterium]
MTKHKLFVIFGIVLLLVLLVGCSEIAAPPSIVSTTFARDYDGEDATDVFGPTDTIYCLVKLDNYKVQTGRKETEVKAVWKTADGQEVGQMQVAASYVTLNDTVRFEFKHEGPWEPGQYTADLYLNGEFDRTINFQVQ